MLSVLGLHGEETTRWIRSAAGFCPMKSITYHKSILGLTSSFEKPHVCTLAWSDTLLSYLTSKLI